MHQFIVLYQIAPVLKGFSKTIQPGLILAASAQQTMINLLTRGPFLGMKKIRYLNGIVGVPQDIFSKFQTMLLATLEAA